MPDEESKHHYGFGHRALPSLLFSDPAWALGVLHGPDAHSLLLELWTRAGSRQKPEHVRDAAGLASTLSITDTYALATIVFPAPQTTAECHMSALYAPFARPGTRDFQHVKDVRYFTLEHGVDISKPHSPPCTFFCEWTRGGLHRNLGLGPMPPTPEAFHALIHSQWQREQTDPAARAISAGAGPARRIT